MTVVWTLPYVIDFLIYNERRAKLLRHKELCDFNVYEAGWCAREMRVAWRVVSNAKREMPCRDGVRPVGGGSDVIQWLGWASSGPLCSAVVVQRSDSELSGKISSPPTHSGGKCDDF